MDGRFHMTAPNDAISLGRNDLENALTEWLKTQDFSNEDMEEVVRRVRDFDERTLSDSFFSSVGTGSINLGSFVANVLDAGSDQEPLQTEPNLQASPDVRLAEITAAWSHLSKDTQEVLHLAATEKLTPVTIQGIKALLGTR